MNFFMKHRVALPAKKLLPAVCLMALAGGVSADVLYSYTGPNFNNFEYSSGDDPYAGNFFTSSDFVSVKIKLSDRLPAYSTLYFTQLMVPTFNHTEGISPVTPLSWEMTAGQVSGSSGSRFWAYLTTGATGDIVQWDVEYDQFLPSAMQPGTIFQGADTSIRTTYYPDTGFSLDYGLSCRGDVACLAAFGYPMGRFDGSGEPGVGPQGAWTISTVPVPAAAWLFGSSLAGLGLLRRKNLRR
jgi:hypothetical protein